MENSFDTIIKNLKVVRPGHDDVFPGDIGIRDGRFAAIEHEIPVGQAKQVVDGKGWLAFPGVVDAHMHVGIYHPLEEDAGSESRAAAMGGVTTSLNYIRTGQYYLNRGGPHADFFPEVLRRSSQKFFVDYAYHVAPITRQHIGEMELMVREHGVPSFKIFMFYGNHGLHGRSAAQGQFLMLDEGDAYDIAHFEFVMRELARITEQVPGARDWASLSLHCELGEILTAYTKIVEKERRLEGLAAYSASRPAHSEGLAIFMASYLAHETSCPNINLLHLTSKKAIEAALMMRDLFPHVNFRREVTVGHLLLDTESKAGVHAKVNPPIRPRADVERLWEAVLAGDVDWIVSDHACCAGEHKVHADRPKDIFAAKSGFGGTEYLLSGVVTEGVKRGLSYRRIAELLALNPARRFGLFGKGDITVGGDADLALYDPNDAFVVRAAESPSGQGYTPFEGMALSGRVKQTYLRGEVVFDQGRFSEKPLGRFLKRPYRGVGR